MSEPDIQGDENRWHNVLAVGKEEICPLLVRVQPEKKADPGASRMDKIVATTYWE